ncbi:MAG: hypothetical protein PWP65_635 [Clostridia bacterium]|nr:hypothetical protein [Clostridia bacterium]
MELAEAIRQRRSIRRFKREPVPKEKIEKILQDAFWAPSNMNRQAWEVVVVTGEDHDKLAQIIKGASQYLKVKLEERFPHKPEVRLAALNFIENLGEAGALILVYIPPGDLRWKGIGLGSVKDVYEWEHRNRIHSAAALIQNICLLAYAEGLGTCWMTGPLFVEDAINEYLGISEMELVAVIPIGWPDQSPKAPPRKGDKVRWIGF